jgi:radical SAM superfamily enzyme YgiQ (UPF0313 family)
MFTYWYKNVWAAVKHYKTLYPNACVMLGGIYATLCPDHAKLSGADVVMPGPHPTAKDYAPDPTLVPEPTDYAYMMSSFGCNRACTYCATHLLYGHGIRQTPPEQFMEEVAFLRSKGIYKMWLGDDNILFDHENHIDKICELLISRNCQMEIHITGGMSALDFTQETAHLMRRAGFKEISFALESVDPEVLKQMGRASNVHKDDLLRALSYADKAGFRRIDTNVYFIIGLPYQSKQSVLDTLLFLMGITVWAHPQRLTPIPGTVDFKRMNLEGVDLADLHYKKFTAPGQDSDFLNAVYDAARFCNYGARYATFNLIDSGLLVPNPVATEVLGKGYLGLKIMSNRQREKIEMEEKANGKEVKEATQEGVEASGEKDPWEDW